MRIQQKQNLIVDADDTLWENNIYFERAFDDFCDFLAHSALSQVEVRAVLDEIEIVNSKTHGYGTANFTRNLTECYHQLAERRRAARRSPADHGLRRSRFCIIRSRLFRALGRR